MSFSYTAGADTNIDNMRLLIPDITSPGIFADEELTRIFAIEGELKLAVALACETIATDKAKTATMISLAGEFTEDKRGIPKYWMARATMFRKQVASDPIEEIDNIGYEIGEFGEDDSEYVGDLDD